MFSELTVVVLCLLCSAFFSGMETGMISINRIRLRHHVEEGKPWALVLQDFLDHPDQLLGTTLLGTNLCMIVAAVLVASMGRNILKPWGGIVLGILLALVVLVFCEYLPKAWFQSQPMSRCRPFANVLRVSWVILRPLAAVITWLTRWIVREASAAPESRYPFVTKDELKVLAQEGEEHGVLSARQRIMIHRVFELTGKTASQTMVPRKNMVTVSARATLDEFIRQAEASGHTRLPVFDDAQGKFVGIANVFEALARHEAGAATPVLECMRPAQFVRDTMPLTEVLPRLRVSRQPLCLVTDAQSQILGLLTTENVVQEIVGKL